MILAQAVVDETPSIGRWHRVTVWGRERSLGPEHDQQRVYTLTANNDTEAAQEGIRRFVEEMESQA